MECRICERPSPDLHHIQPRSTAPDRVYDPTNVVPLCRECHDRVHRHEWELCTDGEDLVLYEQEQELKRMPPLLPTELKDNLFHNLEMGRETLDVIRPLLPRLTEEEVITTYQLADSMGQKAWQAKMHCIVDDWRRLRPVKVTTENKVDHIHAKFGIKRAQIYNYLLIFEKFDPEQLAWDIPMRYYLLAARSEQPEKWLEYAVSELADNPAYSGADFEADIRMAGGDLIALEIKVWAECPECGFEGPMLKRRRQLEGAPE